MLMYLNIKPHANPIPIQKVLVALTLRVMSTAPMYLPTSYINDFE